MSGLPPLAALAAAALVALGEWLHARRVRRVARLAFGPKAAPCRWVAAVPFVRVFAVAVLAWGLATLWEIQPRGFRGAQVPEGGWRHIVLVLDVSPSMQLKDAGPGGTQTRMQRAHDVLMSVFERVALEQARVSVIATYNGAKPVVIDTYDLEVVRNILADLPLDMAFDIGRTKLIEGLRLAAEIARPWEPESTALILVSDGDTVPDSGMPEMPRAIRETLVIGVGDARAGKFIDGHQSRQDASTLRQIAGRLRGVYHDANVAHLPSEHLARLATVAPMTDPAAGGRRELALTAVAVGTFLLAAVPLGLAAWGSAWQPARRRAGVVPASNAGAPAGVSTKVRTTETVPP